MPLVFYGIAIFLFFLSVRTNRSRVFLDYESSNVIKGFFILLVVFHHILGCFPYEGFMSTPLSYFRGILGQLIVSMFFFISGYGIIYSIETKGRIYSVSIITNRLLRIFIYTIIGLIPFFIYSAIFKKTHPIGDYFLALIGLKSFGNETWFIFAILFCYFSCSITFLVNWKKKSIPVILISFFIISYILVMFLLGQPSFIWNTIICFAYGMLTCLFKEKIYKFLSIKKWFPFLFMHVSICVIVLLQFFVNYRSPFLIPEILQMWFLNAFFCFFFLCLTKVFMLKSHILSYFGNASFPIFLMHRLVICFFVDVGTIPIECINYFVLFVSSVLIGIPFYYVYKIADKFLINPIVEWNKKIMG